MSCAVIDVIAASRLHFGMFSFGQTGVPQFGGMGAMVASPELRLRVYSAENLTAKGPLANRALQVARQLFAAQSELSEIGQTCQIEIVTSPREHVGLGVGTQLALATVAAIRHFWGLPALSPGRLATAAGRGRRSAVGTYGFCHGGWIIESGKQPGDPLSMLVKRLKIPPAWRFVLMIPTKSQGLYGADERQAFAGLPPVPTEVTERLTRIAMDEILPGLEVADFDAVSDSLYRFNRAAGDCFAPWQNGAYADEATAALVEQLRSWGAVGVGQSSWGPTVFALVRDESSAAELLARLQQEILVSDYDLVLAQPVNEGAKILVG
ncbi:MAG: hypothetical protein IT427_05115 [Pirellulales bacterium]|nr:hypothetical protein [Pirellulales bacterium]